MDTTALTRLATGVADAIDAMVLQSEYQVYYTGPYAEDPDHEYSEIRPRKMVSGAVVRAALTLITGEIRAGVAVGELKLSRGAWRALHCGGLEVQHRWEIYSSPLPSGPVCSAGWRLAEALRSEDDEDVAIGLRHLEASGTTQS